MPSPLFDPTHRQVGTTPEGVPVFQLTDEDGNIVQWNGDGTGMKNLGPAHGAAPFQPGAPATPPAAPPAKPPGGGGDFGSLVSGNQPGTPNLPPANPGAQPPPAGSNYNQNQSGAQGGAFNTSGNSQNTTSGLTLAQLTNFANQFVNQHQTSGSNTTGSGTSSNVGSATNNGTSGSLSSGGSNSNAIDTLGFGGLLKGQAGAVGANDTARSAFLRDTMQTGGSALGSQVDQAIRTSQSGPGMTGAGSSARDRAAGYAGAQIARQNGDQRLEASRQLSGPTGLATLSSAANPYIGQANTNTGSVSNTNQGTSTSSNVGSNTSASNNTGFNNLIGSSQSTGGSSSSTATSGTNNNQENTSGVALGNSASSANGIIPSSQQVSSGGGCVLCTAATELGLFRNLRVLRRVIDFKMRRHRFAAASRGYFFMFTPVAVYLLSRPKLARLLYPLARAVVYEELRLSGRRLPLRVWAWIVHWSGHSVCAAVGKLPVPRGVKSPIIETLAKKYNIWFPLS